MNVGANKLTGSTQEFWLVKQAQMARWSATGTGRAAVTYQPHPKGKFLKGSATDKVFGYFAQAAERWSTRKEVLQHTKLPPKHVDWALFYLNRNGYLEVRDSDGFLMRRYRAKVCVK